MLLTFTDKAIIRSLIDAEIATDHPWFVAVFAAALRVFGLAHASRLEAVAHRVCRRRPRVKG